MLVRNDAENPIIVPPANLPATSDTFEKNIDLNLGKKIQIKKFALTYPRCDLEPSIVLDKIKSHPKVKQAGLDFIVVSQEKHQDGGLHIHVCLLTKSPLRYTDRDGSFWDFATGQHGNYQRIRVVSDWLRYIIKDNLYLAYPETFVVTDYLIAAKKHKDYSRVQVSREIRDGNRNIHDINNEHPSFVLMNRVKVVGYINLCNAADTASIPLLTFPDVVDPMSMSKKELTIYAWFHAVKTGHYAGLKRHEWKHLRIEGGTGVGKTALSLLMQKFLRFFTMPYKCKWWDGYNEVDFDLIFGDEFRSQVTIQDLNSICDGAACALPMRGQASFVHNVKKPVLLLSNYTWEGSYSKVYNENPIVLEAVKRRFNTIVLEPNENLYKLLKSLDKLILDIAYNDMDRN